MGDLRRYGALCPNVVEFGVRDGNSASAFLAAGCNVHGFDIVDPMFEVPDDALSRWNFTKADTAKLQKIPACDLLFIDSLHTKPHVAEELRMARFVRKFILFHDWIEWGVHGEDTGTAGVGYAILDFLTYNPQWEIREALVDRWGLFVIGRKKK